MDQNVIDHKALVASLDDDQRLMLTAKSDKIGLMTLAGHFVCLTTTGLWIAAGLPFWQAVLVVHGIQLVFLFTLLHETVHETPFASPILNRLIGRVCGFLIFLPPLWFRYFHLAHHRYTHDSEKDPELEGKPVNSISRYLWVVTGIPVWWFHLKTLVANANGKADYAYLPGSAAVRIKTEARIMLGLYAAMIVVSFYLGSTALLWLWIVPILLGQPFLRLYLMAEHGRCPHVANMLENTRTTFTNRLVRWLAWNMPYHAEHHAYPSVPFHKLPDFHKVAKEHLRITENGYTAFQRKNINALARGKNQ